MKTRFQFILFLFLLTFILGACDKDNDTFQEPPIALEDLYSCYYNTTWDSLSIRDNLIGTWEWEYYQCAWVPENANGSDYEGLRVEFKSDNTVKIRENRFKTTTSTWKLVKLYDSYFYLEVSSRVEQLSGQIFFCGESLVFSNMPSDGCDHYFRRISK